MFLRIVSAIARGGFFALFAQSIATLVAKIAELALLRRLKKQRGEL